MNPNHSLPFAILNTVWKLLYVACFVVHVATKIVRRALSLGLYLVLTRICFGPIKKEDDDPRR